MTFGEALNTLDDTGIHSAYLGHISRLEHLFSGANLDTPFMLDGISASTTSPAIDPIEWFVSSVIDLAEHMTEARNRRIFRPMSICCNPHGVHFVDGIFGARVFLHDFSAEWQVKPLTIPVGTLQRPDIEYDGSWLLVKRVASLFLEHDPPNVIFELPTLSSALNIALNLYGQEILIAMMENPAAAHHDMRVINEVIMELHAWFRDHIPIDRLQPIVSAGRFQPMGRGQICGCSTQLLSNELYEEFAAPLDRAVLSAYPGPGMIHLCGSHTHHIGSWAGMRQLQAVQLNDRAATDLEAYFSGLRNDQVLYVNYFEGMTAGDAIEITAGRRLVLVGDLDSTV